MGRFWPLFLEIISLPLSLSFSSEISITCMLVVLRVSDRSLRLCSLTSIIFLSVPRTRSFPLFCDQVHWFFCLPEPWVALWWPCRFSCHTPSSGLSAHAHAFCLLIGVCALSVHCSSWLFSTSSFGPLSIFWTVFKVLSGDLPFRLPWGRFLFIFSPFDWAILSCFFVWLVIFYNWKLYTWI